MGLARVAKAARCGRAATSAAGRCGRDFDAAALVGVGPEGLRLGVNFPVELAVLAAAVREGIGLPESSAPGGAPTWLGLRSGRRRVPARPPGRSAGPRPRPRRSSADRLRTCPAPPRSPTPSSTPGIRLDVDAPGSVGIHHDRRPAPELGIPRKRPARRSPRTRRPRSPDRPAASVGALPLLSVECPGVSPVEIDQLVVSDVTEVAIDVVIEGRCRRTRVSGLPPELGRCRGPRPGPSRPRPYAEVDVFRGDRVVGALELLSIRGEVAIIVAAESVGGQHGDAADQQHQADQPADAGEDHPDHAARGPIRTRPGAGLAAVFEGERCSSPSVHRAKPTWRKAARRDSESPTSSRRPPCIRERA